MSTNKTKHQPIPTESANDTSKESSDRTEIRELVETKVDDDFQSTVRPNPSSFMEDNHYKHTGSLNVTVGGLGSISVLALAITVRLFNAMSAITYFSPDEFWQSWEVAHKMVYGYGYLTWEWIHKIRSIFYPSIIASVFYGLKATGLDTYSLLILAPKILHGLIAAAGDYFTVKLAVRFYGESITGWITFCTLTSWFHLFVSTRALSSSPEMAVTVAALYYWPFAGISFSNPWSLGLSLLLAALACILRPTSAVIWIYLGVQQLLYPHKELSRIRIFFTASVIMALALGSMVLLDTIYFGEWILVPWRFFQFNVAQKISAFYGMSSWHFYPLLGVPTLLTTFLPFLYMGSRKSLAAQKLLGMSGFVICVYSLLPHKELRFIYPVLPGFLVVVARGLQLFKPTRVQKALLILSQVGIAFYFNRWHQSGVVEVMHHLHYDSSVKSVGFLMPCHSTPYHSFLHRPLPMWFLTCHPPLDQQPISTYKDVSDLFYDEPAMFITNKLTNQSMPNPTLDFSMYINSNSTLEFNYFWPSHLVIFESLLTSSPEILEIFNRQNYRLCQSIFNSHFHDDPRRRGHVQVFCR